MAITATELPSANVPALPYLRLLILIEELTMKRLLTITALACLLAAGTEGTASAAATNGNLREDEDSCGGFSWCLVGQDTK